MDGVERGPDGLLRWVRRVPDKPHQDRVTIVHERYLPPSQRGHARDRPTTHGQIRRRPPSFSEIERLLEIYVTTGEGQGSFLAAQVWEETYGPYYGKIESENRYRYPSPESHIPRASLSSSSSDSDSKPVDQPAPRTGPSGGPEGSVRPASSLAETEQGSPSVLQPTHHYQEERHTTRRRATHASRTQDYRVWIPLRTTRNDDRRFLHVGDFDPTRRAEYEPDFAGAAYIDELGPQSINTLGAAYIRAERRFGRGEERIVDPVAEDPAAPTGRRYQAHVDDAPEDEDGRQPIYADLRPHEDDVGANTHTGGLRRRRSSRPQFAKRTTMMRGGGLDYDPEEPRSIGDGPSFLRLRGGGPGVQPPTATSAIVPSPGKIVIEPREIE